MPESVTTLSSQLQQIDPDAPLPFALLHADDSLLVILYHPQGEDQQTPHDQDEFYFVASGDADFFVSGEVRHVNAGDALFVPALAQHRFIDPSEDFACWAIFYGPKKLPE